MSNQGHIFTAAILFILMSVSLAYKVSKRENKNIIKILLGIEKFNMTNNKEKIWLFFTFALPLVIFMVGNFIAAEQT